MKALNTYIIEKFQVAKDNIKAYKYYPETKEELIQCIKEKIEQEGLGTKDKPLDLNDIDTSMITDMSKLFDSAESLIELSENGNFDISEWDVSNVTDMMYMFYGSSFDGDISNWDVSNVKNMDFMFYYCKFDGDISNWDVSNVKDMRNMFGFSWFTGKNGDISKWNVSNVEIMYRMFCGSHFNGNIDDWAINDDTNTNQMFERCPFLKNTPKWYKE